MAYFPITNNQDATNRVPKNPIQMKRSLFFTDDYLYYKRLRDMVLGVSDENMKKIYSRAKYLGVVISAKYRRIKTIYLTLVVFSNLRTRCRFIGFKEKMKHNKIKKARLRN